MNVNTAPVIQASKTDDVQTKLAQVKTEDSKPIAANYLKSDTLPIKDKLHLSGQGIGIGSAAAVVATSIPAAAIVFIGAGSKSSVFLGGTMLASAAVSGLAIGAASSFVKTDRQASTLGFVVGAGVGAASGFSRAGIPGAVINGAVGGVSGWLAGSISADIHAHLSGNGKLPSK